MQFFICSVHQILKLAWMCSFPGDQTRWKPSLPVNPCVWLGKSESCSCFGRIRDHFGLLEWLGQMNGWVRGQNESNGATCRLIPGFSTIFLTSSSLKSYRLGRNAKLLFPASLMWGSAICFLQLYDKYVLDCWQLLKMLSASFRNFPHFENYL